MARSFMQKTGTMNARMIWNSFVKVFIFTVIIVTCVHMARVRISVHLAVFSVAFYQKISSTLKSLRNVLVMVLRIHLMPSTETKQSKILMMIFLKKQFMIGQYIQIFQVMYSQTKICLQKTFLHII